MIRAFLLGFALGMLTLLYIIGRSMGTSGPGTQAGPTRENPRARRVRTPVSRFVAQGQSEDELPEFDPYLWQERMK